MQPTADPRPASDISGYHAHIYYRNDAEKAEAAVLRRQLTAGFEVEPGRWRDEPVGPHPLPMYQIAFAADVFAALVPWLMLNRRGLTILVHPRTGEDVPDHETYPLWLGEKLPLDVGFLRRFASA
ncbi:MAG: 4,5-dioxygenase [Rhizobiales bacterium NRL2]|jgi:DOPA 4,5-dioxygenase|nr:MAG: 4,5-dioxygenase [Rhizobiales bacterium NRL2]